ncbi:hypothetical protein L1987_03786 [Smallanthus sonchifolius]|uniref:Uncharacterized protein n=1 Tax=Smallanthus sonchifolius TaxID=185202 RepID=A0ACB9KBS8_9ASTR|nr:hypothetical protein L1987_03786 [Smallanthus sonchifolius]
MEQLEPEGWGRERLYPTYEKPVIIKKNLRIQFEDGEEFAVKRLLRGFSIEERERLLVYDYLTNGSLDRFIFEMNQKIADFGLATLFNPGETERDAEIVKTCGYIAPEYINSGHFSMKTDVFSYGVLILEIIAGERRTNRHSEDAESVVSHAWACWQNQTLANIIDPLMNAGPGALNHVTRTIQIVLPCLQINDTQRPIMDQIFSMLDRASHDPNLRVPVVPLQNNTTTPLQSNNNSCSAAVTISKITSRD